MSFLNNYDPMIPGERTGFFTQLTTHWWDSMMRMAIQI